MPAPCAGRETNTEKQNREETLMRIVVIGAGGIGGWLGARLAATGQQIGFLVHGGTLEALHSGEIGRAHV